MKVAQAQITVLATFTLSGRVPDYIIADPGTSLLKDGFRVLHVWAKLLRNNRVIAQQTVFKTQKLS